MLTKAIACSGCRPEAFGADDGIRTRDPHLGKVLESVRPVLPRPSTWAPSVSSSGKGCQIRPVVTRVTTGRSAVDRRAAPLASNDTSTNGTLG